MITAKSIVQSNQTGKIDDALSAALQETILYEDYTDAINCAITVDEAKNYKKKEMPSDLLVETFLEIFFVSFQKQSKMKLDEKT